MFKLSRSIIMLIAAIFILTSLISCSSDNQNNQENPANDSNVSNDKNNTTENVTEAPTEDLYKTDYLPEENYGGCDFTILTFEDGGSGTNLFIAEEQIGEVVHDALYKRNLTVEERFNIRIKGIGLGWGETPKAVQKSVNAGDHSYDLLVLHTLEACAPLLNNGLAYNWLKVPHVDLDKPWYEQSVRDLMEINGYLPYIVSDFNYGSYPYTFAMVFNKSFVQKYALENPYDLVRNGDWTLDKFGEMVKSISQDVNGDGMYDERDLYGLVTDDGIYPTNFTPAIGELFVRKTADNGLELSVYSEKHINLVNKLYDIYFVGNSTIVYKWDEPSPIPIEDNRSFIHTTTLSALPYMRSLDVEFGILPYPKYDKQQEKYLTSVDGRGTVLALPVDTVDLEKAGMIVEALSAESRRYVVPAYYDIALKHKDIRDEESGEMLDIIFAGRIYDLGYMYDSGICRILMPLIQKRSSDLTSLYEKDSGRWQRFYDKIAEKYAAALN